MSETSKHSQVKPLTKMWSIISNSLLVALSLIKKKGIHQRYANLNTYLPTLADSIFNIQINSP